MENDLDRFNLCASLGSSKDRVELVRYALKHRADVNATDKRNHTRLDVAKGSRWNDKAIVKAFLERAAEGCISAYLSRAQRLCASVRRANR